MIRPFPTFTLVLALIGCGAPRILTQDRQLYNERCARAGNVWRMYYEGSDSAWHYFHVNDMDRWAEVRIPADQIRMVEPVHYHRTASDTTSGYWVDPCDGFRRSKPWLGMKR